MRRELHATLGDLIGEDGVRHGALWALRRARRLVVATEPGTRAASGPSRRRGLTTLPGALFAMSTAIVMAGLVSSFGFGWMSKASLPDGVEVGALALVCTLLFGSLVNLVAVVGGCWD